MYLQPTRFFNKKLTGLFIGVKCRFLRSLCERNSDWFYPTCVSLVAMQLRRKVEIGFKYRWNNRHISSKDVSFCCISFLVMIHFALKMVSLILASHTTPNRHGQQKACRILLFFGTEQHSRFFSFEFTGIARKSNEPHKRFPSNQHCSSLKTHVSRLNLHFCDPVITSYGNGCVKEGTNNSFLYSLI